jgi:ATP-dependent helicase/nuclease subunit B
MTAEIIDPRFGLIESIAGRLRPDGKDYGATWVVFPEKRPGYYLRQALARKEGSAFIPPRVDSIEGFIDRVFEERLKAAGRPLDPLDAIKILFDLHRSSSSPLSGPSFLTPDGFFHLGAKLFQDLESLLEAGVPVEEVRKLDHVTEEGRKRRIPAAAWNRLQSLSFFYERFYAVLHDLGLSTPASRLRQVATRITPDLFPDIREFIFADFYALSETEKTLLGAVARWPNARILFLDGQGVGEAIAAIGVEPGSVPRPASSGHPGPRLRFIKSPDTHGQVFALNGLFQDKLTMPGGLGDKQAIVLPAAETLFPLYHQTLSVLGEDAYNISMGYPMSRTPLYSFFDKLLDVLQSADENGRVYAPAYLRFVLHPYAKNIYFSSDGGLRSDLTRVLFHAVEEEFTLRRMKAFWSLDELETDPAIWWAVQERILTLDRPPTLVDLRSHLQTIHDRLFGVFGEIRDVADFATKTTAVLSFLYETSTARLHQFFHPFAEAFQTRLRALARSRFGTVAFEDRSSYFSLFRKVVSSGVVPFAGTPLRGLQVLGFWEARGIPFENVVLLDMNEGVVPSFKRSDTLLPLAVRRELKMPTFADLERRMAYYLDTLLRGAGEVDIFFVENDEKERSRFVETLIWERQKADRRADAGTYVRSFQYAVKLRAEVPRPITKTPDTASYLRDFRYSASALNAYLACPLQFYYAYVLRLREKEGLDESLDRRDIGTLVHDILQRYFQRFVGKTMTAASLREKDLDAAVEGHFRERYGPDQRGGIFLMMHQVRRHLVEFLRAYQIPMVQGLKMKKLTVLELESPKMFDLPVDGATYGISVKMDRTERRGEDLYILDYKTGASEKFLKVNFDGLFGVTPEMMAASPRESCGEYVKNVQLPLYTLAYAHIHGLSPERVRARFLLLGKTRLGPEVEVSPFDEDDGEKRRKQIGFMERFLGVLLGEITDPAKPFRPTSAFDACAECPYVYLCDRKT